MAYKSETIICFNKIGALTCLIILLLLNHGCAKYRVKNLSMDNSNWVNVPITNGPKTGWMIINNKKIVRYGYSDNTQTSIARVYPEAGYGDIFSLQEYPNISKEEFYSLIVLYCSLNWISVKNDDISSSDACVIESIMKSINLIKSDNGLSNDIKIEDCFFENKQKGKKNEKEDDNKKLKYEMTKHRLINIYHAINSDEAPAKLFIHKGNYNNITYAARKEFSIITVKTSAVFIPEEQYFGPSAHFSIYPCAAFSVKEKSSDYLDRLSFDIGMIGKSKDSSTSEKMNNADNRYIYGLGIELGKNIAFQLGDCLWYEKGDTHHSFFMGVSLDLFNLASYLTSISK